MIRKSSNTQSSNDQKIGKDLLVISFFQVVLYIIQYIVIPSIFSMNPTDSTANTFYPMISTFVVCFVGMYKYKSEFLYWILTIPIHYFLLELYCPIGLYGYNYKQPFMNMFYPTPIIIITVITLLYEFITWCIVKVILNIMNDKW